MESKRITMKNWKTIIALASAATFQASTGTLEIQFGNGDTMQVDENVEVLKLLQSSKGTAYLPEGLTKLHTLELSRDKSVNPTIILPKDIGKNAD